jgi:hypothetical protein
VYANLDEASSRRFCRFKSAANNQVPSLQVHPKKNPSLSILIPNFDFLRGVFNYESDMKQEMDNAPKERPKKSQATTLPPLSLKRPSAYAKQQVQKYREKQYLHGQFHVCGVCHHTYIGEGCAFNTPHQ